MSAVIEVNDTDLLVRSVRKFYLIYHVVTTIHYENLPMQYIEIFFSTKN